MFFNDTATTEIYTLSLHDALPIWLVYRQPARELDANAGICARTRSGYSGTGLIPNYQAKKTGPPGPVCVPDLVASLAGLPFPSGIIGSQFLRVDCADRPDRCYHDPGAVLHRNSRSQFASAPHHSRSGN